MSWVRTPFRPDCFFQTSISQLLKLCVQLPWSIINWNLSKVTPLPSCRGSRWGSIWTPLQGRWRQLTLWKCFTVASFSNSRDFVGTCCLLDLAYCREVRENFFFWSQRLNKYVVVCRGFLLDPKILYSTNGKEDDNDLLATNLWVGRSSWHASLN